MKRSPASFLDELSIVEWYQRQTCLITGGTGFMGKALIYKLLQCGVQKMYILVRTKRGQDPEQRLDTMAKQEIFNPIREKDPHFRSRMIAIVGDVTERNLAISEPDLVTIKNETTVVFHVAASVKFDDPLKEAVHYNLRSTRDLVEISKNIKNLKMFHYVSTAYSNCEQIHDKNPNGVEEKVYQPKINYEKLIDFVDNTPDMMINALEKKILGSSCNTYTFTKHMAEAVVYDAGRFIPVVITRPQIVIPSVSEPYPGWTGNVSSPVMVIHGAAKGIVRIMLSRTDLNKAYVAVDLAINCMLVATWKEVVMKEENSIANVYNMHYRPMTNKYFHDTCMEILKTHPPYNSLWKTIFYSTNSMALYFIGHLFLHLIPGLFFDTLLRLAGQKPRLIQIYRKLYAAILVLHPILQLNDRFEIKNHYKLANVIPKEELQLFPLDMSLDQASWRRYLQNSGLGIRKLLKEPGLTEKDLIHQRRLLWLHNSLKGVFIVTFLWNFPFMSTWSFFASICSVLGEHFFYYFLRNLTHFFLKMTSQGMRNTAVLQALHTHYFLNGTGSYIKKNDFALITFAPVIGGVLLCLVIGIGVGFLLLMREKRKRIQEATSLSNLPWLDTLEVFAVTDREAAPGMFLPLPNGAVNPSPPPTYDTVVKVNEKSAEAEGGEQKAVRLSPMRTPGNTPSQPAALPPDDLPTYDAAVKMDGNM